MGPTAVRRLGSLIGVLALAASACGTNDGSPAVSTPAASPASFRWRPVAKAPLQNRSGHAAVWTGREVVVWGGAGGEAPVHDDGAAYDPATDSWRALPASPFGPRTNHSVVWTGTEAIFFEGSDGGEAGRDSGAALDVVSGTWRQIARAPIDPHAPSVTWVGSQMIVWGGVTTSDREDAYASDGFAYEPSGDTWQPLPGAPIEGRTAHTALWSGTELLVWGGFRRDAGENRRLADGAAYDPLKRSWRTIAAAPLESRSGHAAVWTGTEMIVWGGEPENGTPFSDGAAYDPRRDAWRTLGSSPRSVSEASTVWSRSELIAWGGRPDGGETSTNEGLAYDPSRNAWRAVPAAPLDGRTSHVAVATSTGMFVWGGRTESGPHLTSDDGAFLEY